MNYIRKFKFFLEKINKEVMEWFMDNEDNKQNSFPYILPYKTGEEMLALKGDLFLARERILATHPNIQEEYEKRAAYSKYSKNDGELSALNPSLVGYPSIGAKVPRMTSKIPKNDDGYREFLFDSEDNLLLSRLIWQGEAHNYLYAVDYEGYKYLFSLGDFSNVKTPRYVCRMKYENGKIAVFEEYCSYDLFLFGGVYTSEIYYTVGEKHYCTLQGLADKYENPETLQELERRAKEHPKSEQYYEENVKKQSEFLENVKLPVIDKISPVKTWIYELTYNNHKLEQIDEMRFPDGQFKTVFPKKPKSPTGLPKTKGAKKDFKQMLKGNGCTTKSKIAFSAFWNTFKAFALECKYDCSADDLLWEPFLNTIHIARQFCHDDGSGNFDYMEQLNIDIDIDFNQSSDVENKGTFWSDDGFEKFFAKVEQTKEFKSIPADAVVELNIIFGEV